MKKSFDEIKRMLEEKNLLFSATQLGEKYEIHSIATRSLESNPYNKLVILRSGEVYSDVELEGRVSFLAPLCTLDRKVQKLLEKREFGSLPFQLFTVQEVNLDAAEAAIREFLSDKPKVKKEDTPKASSTVADIEAYPEDKWVDTHLTGGRCPYCGKKLELLDRCECKYASCDCEVGKAAYAHNQRASEIFHKKEEQRKKMFSALKTVEDIKNFPKEIFIPMLNHDDGSCPFCGSVLPSRKIDVYSWQYADCTCNMFRAAKEHNKHATVHL